MSSDGQRRARALILTPRYPYPVIGGDRLRIYHVCKELAKQCELTLLSLCDTRGEMTAPLPEDGVFARIERIYMPRWRSRLNALFALPTSTPLQVAYYRNERFANRALSLLREHDLCVAHLIRTGDVVRRERSPRVLEMTDAISLNYARVQERGSRRDWRTWVFGVEARRLLNYERTIINDFDLVTLVSDVDRDFLLEGQKQPHVLVCSNGVDLSRLPYREPSRPDSNIVFIGDIRTAQNLDACRFFIDSVLPQLRAQGDFTFRIIGRIGADEAKSLASHDGVEVLANVDSIPRAVGDAFAGIAPMRLGAGVQNKVLEYMALGLPVVTSSVGLEGLQARIGAEVLVADSPAEYVRHLLHLATDQDSARALARAARTYVEEQHLWSGRLAPMLSAINAMLPPAGVGGDARG